MEVASKRPSSGEVVIIVAGNHPVSHLSFELGEEDGHCYQDAMTPWEAGKENLS